MVKPWLERDSSYLKINVGIMKVAKFALGDKKVFLVSYEKCGTLSIYQSM